MEIINLDMTPSTVTPNAHAGQYDSARTVRFMLKNGGVPFTLAGTETITAEITRPDNTEVTVNVANTSSNYVDVVFDDTVCTVKGLYACELRLKDSDGFDIGSKNFALLVQRDPYDGTGVRIVTVGPADICTFETTLAEPLQSVIVNVLATGGNGTPDNPNPINGFTEAKITRCGVNLWDEQWEVGTINNNTGALVPNSSIIRSKNFIPVSGGATILIYATSASNMWMRVFEYDKNENFIASDAKYTGSTYQLNANTAYLKFYMKSDYGTTYNNDISILYPSTLTPAYHAYNGQTYTIAFGQTVYGGVLDVTRGKLHVTHLRIIFDGTETYNNAYFPSVICNKTVPVGSGSSADMICSRCPSDENWIAYASSTRNRIQFSKCDTNWNVSSADDLKALIAQWYANGNPIEIVYPLATPFDIDLTPQQIEALLGVNNVFADCGKTTVKYLKAGA